MFILALHMVEFLAYVLLQLLVLKHSYLGLTDLTFPVIVVLSS